MNLKRKKLCISNYPKSAHNKEVINCTKDVVLIVNEIRILIKKLKTEIIVEYIKIKNNLDSKMNNII